MSDLQLFKEHLFKGESVLKKWILSLAVLSSVQVFAADSTEATFKVKQIIKSHKLVVVQTNSTEQFPNGKIFLATFNDDSQCSLILKNSGKQLLTLDSTPCDQPEKLTLKMQIEPSLISVEENLNAQATQGAATKRPIENKVDEQKPEQNPDNFYDKSTVGRLGVSLYYSSANELEFDKAKTNTSSAEVNVNFKLENAVGVGLHYMRAKPNAWGYSVGGLLESTRKFKGFTVSANGNSITVNATNDDTKLTLLIAEGNALYRFENFYIPFGLNFSIPVLEYVSTSSKVEALGSIGIQFGMGYFINDNLSAEIYYRSIGMQLKETSNSNSDEVDYGYGYLRGVALGVKYLF